MLDIDIVDFNGEPRMRDIDIAEALGFERVRNVRKLIVRYIDTLEEFGALLRFTAVRASAGRSHSDDEGRDTVARSLELRSLEVRSTVEQTSDKGGRPGTEYWLNEEQALFICTKSDAKGAIALTKQMVIVFAEWRNGRLAPPVATAQPKIMLPDDAHIWRGLIREARLLFGRTGGRWLWEQSPLPQIPDFVDELAPPGATEDPLESFLRDTCVVTGSCDDFTLSRDLLAIYQTWITDTGAQPMASGAAARRLRALSERYRDPQADTTFRKHKRCGDWGYLGLRFRSSE